MRSLKTIKHRLYYYFAEKNWGVRREYGPYVDAHQEDHHSHRWKHWWLLIRLNWHYRILRSKKFLIREMDPALRKKTGAPAVPYMPKPESRKRNWTNAYRLAQSLLNYDLISFDIFDTLLVRKTMFPKDIFEIVEAALIKAVDGIQEFARIRIKAEDNCYKKGMNPTIYQIYDEIGDMTECSKDVLLRYLDKEIKTEKKFLCARKSMLKFFDEIKEKKQVYLISDMYLPSVILKDILQECGYTGYKDIYVSCEQGYSKSDGLFEKFIEQDTRRKNAIHIGDNENADGRSAENAGLDVFLIMNKMEMLENSSYNVIIDKAEALLDRVSIGLFCNRAFDNPFALYGTKGKLRIEDYRDIAYLFIAPEE